MMNYEEFKKEVTENIKEHLSSEYDDVTVSIHDVVKNNDQHLDGLMIKDESVNISPTIYLNSFYEEYVDGADMDEILDKIAGIYEANVVDHDFDLSTITDFEAATKAAPSLGCLIAPISAYCEITFMVSDTLSPLAAEEFDASAKPSVLPPRRSIAVSKDSLVLVLGS